MILGTLGSIGTGIVVPLITYYLTMFNSIIISDDNDYRREKGNEVLMYFIYIGIFGFLSGWAMVTFWLITGERQASKCRRLYFEALMRQDLSFYDCQDQS
jgi:ATP-binding cassette subfamily B (MDR/TAP) protein 1